MSSSGYVYVFWSGEGTLQLGRSDRPGLQGDQACPVAPRGFPGSTQGLPGVPWGCPGLHGVCRRRALKLLGLILSSWVRELVFWFLLVYLFFLVYLVFWAFQVSV